MMLSIERILIDGSLISLLIGGFLVMTLVINPRVWLKDYPEAIRNIAPPLTRNEKRLQTAITIPLLIGFLVLPYLSARAFASESPDISVVVIFFHVFAIANMFNLFDAVVLDWLMLEKLRPRFMFVAEARDHMDLLVIPGKGLRDWIKGVGICTVMSVLITVAVVLIG